MKYLKKKKKKFHSGKVFNPKLNKINCYAIFSSFVVALDFIFIFCVCIFGGIVKHKKKGKKET